MCVHVCVHTPAFACNCMSASLPVCVCLCIMPVHVQFVIYIYISACRCKFYRDNIQRQCNWNVFLFCLFASLYFTWFYHKKVLHNKPLGSVRQVDWDTWQVLYTGCSLLRTLQRPWILCDTIAYFWSQKPVTLGVCCRGSRIPCWQKPKGRCRWHLLRLRGVS